MRSMPARYKCKLSGEKNPWIWTNMERFFSSQHYSIITIKDTEYTRLGVLSSWEMIKGMEENMWFRWSDLKGSPGIKTL